MKKLYNILNILLWVFIGVFIGNSIYKYYDYRTHYDLTGVSPLNLFFFIISISEMNRRCSYRNIDKFVFTVI